MTHLKAEEYIALFKHYAEKLKTTITYEELAEIVDRLEVLVETYRPIYETDVKVKVK